MGFYESLCKKYSYESRVEPAGTIHPPLEEPQHLNPGGTILPNHNWGSIQGYKGRHLFQSILDVALFGSAIRVPEWKELHRLVTSTNKCNFKIFFCGHARPNFDLPDNLIYIYSDMTPAACVEIAYRHAMSSNSDYIMNITDDCTWTPGMLDSLIEEFKSHEKQSSSELVVGPSYINSRGRRPMDLHLVQNDHSTPQALVFSMMKRITAYRTGGLDKRFEGVNWDLDRYLRLHALEEDIKFKVCDDLVISESPGGTLSSRCVRSDREILDSLWSWWPCIRSEPVQYYTNDDLIFTLDYNKQ